MRSTRGSPTLAAQVSRETQDAVLELTTRPHGAAQSAAAEASDLRARLSADLEPLGLQAASAGTHPCALWTETRIASGERHQSVYGSMRELARREPTFGLHVHVGVSDPESAITLHNRLRPHLPLLLALSANSPFWQGRDSGLASAGTPIFQVFPRVGPPRAFADYADYVEAVDRLLRCDAFPDPTYLWWDVRPQPKFGTVEVRIMDVQSESWATSALTALVQMIARLELEEGYHSHEVAGGPEVRSGRDPSAGGAERGATTASGREPRSSPFGRGRLAGRCLLTDSWLSDLWQAGVVIPNHVHDLRRGSDNARHHPVDHRLRGQGRDPVVARDPVAGGGSDPGPARLYGAGARR
jgi:YbdK family carboxylate-amine ligase